MLTKEELSEIRNLKTVADNDNIRLKELVKKRLYQNKYIIHFLNNPDLDENAPDEYIGVNILPYIIVPETQTTPRNYICYTCGFDQFTNSNASIKNANITITIMCEVKTIIDKETGIQRHDLLGAFVRDLFHKTNIFGTQCELISDKESTTDNDFAARVMIFKIMNLNSMLKTKNGVTYFLDNEVRT